VYTHTCARARACTHSRTHAHTHTHTLTVTHKQGSGCAGGGCQGCGECIQVARRSAHPHRRRGVRVVHTHTHMHVQRAHAHTHIYSLSLTHTHAHRQAVLGMLRSSHLLAPLRQRFLFPLFFFPPSLFLFFTSPSTTQIEDSTSLLSTSLRFYTFPLPLSHP